MRLILLLLVFLEMECSNILAIDPGGTFHIRKYNEFYYKVSVTADGPRNPRGHMYSSSTVDFGRFVAFWEHQNLPC